MSRLNLAGLSAVLLLVTASAAEAKQWKHAGMHPRTGQPADGLCHIETTHVHSAAPLYGDTLYRTRDDVHVFIGDPTPFGYEGPRHSYYGHHPVVLNVLLRIEVDVDVVEYCYHDGPHYHAYEPPPRQTFVDKEDVHYYAGEYPEEYKRENPRRGRINAVYRPWGAPRPAVTFAPPPQYRGPIIQVGVNVDVRVGSPRPPPPREVIIIREDNDRDHGHGHGHGHGKHKKHKHKKFKGRD
ncbi:hypothetical protein G4177_12485 [Corallococcus sp. ZKHCc1 1396]|uniref:Uncharacterized protein n=1 Tax=Corallococcus soli TaxID=2710757 RepID=A0ABR9PM74_9BACT|nr:MULTISPECIES: hypothetical protein [Corallococcus]MBE4748979.1 hypothetical protein [Corallococcus soli]MCY1032279.1 hypothetical protein [Corallococcus sp. BB11-1]RYZ35446.1 MAG: hypothetical protein EOO72_12130 [Myxococcaceae bacterium]